MNPTRNFTKVCSQPNSGIKQKFTFPIHDVILKEIIFCTEVSELDTRYCCFSSHPKQQ